MFSFTLSVIFIPIALVIAGLTLVRRRGDPETVEHRTFLFMAWTAIGIIALVLVYWVFPHPGLGVLFVFVPILPAVVVLVLLRVQEWHTLHRGVRISLLSILLLLLILTVVQFWSITVQDGEGQLEAVFLGLIVVSVTMFLFVTWTWGNRSSILTGVLALLYLSLFNLMEWGSLSMLSESQTGSRLLFLSTLAYLAVPGFTLSAAALMASNALHAIPGKSGTGFSSWRPFIGNLLLVMLLLGGLTYTFIWLWRWDGTDDGIRGLVILAVSGMVSFSAGMIIAVTSSGWKRWAGFLFPALVIILLSQPGIAIGNRLTNDTVTEQRAMHIQAAVENYQATTGSYPTALDDLVPGEMWRIPRPMIIPGQDWCYESGPDHYRLGLVYRDHWSSPYSDVRVYAAAGNVPETTWVCDEKLAEHKSQSDAVFNSPPTPVPLPTSVTSVDRIRIDPLYKESSFSVGSWSPDGAYLVFGSTEYFMDEVEHVTIDLRFLDARTGDICQPEPSMWTVQKSNGLRDHHAWLPDGRFLYVTDEGEMAAFEPCSVGMEDLADRFPVSFTHAVTFEAESGRVLLKNQEGYWLLDGSRLEVQPVAGVPVSADDGSWTWYAWSQGGARLAISMLLGQEGSDGGFLYIITEESGEVMQSLPLPDASDAYLPIAEWLTRDDLLIHGNSLTLLDLRSDPPARTDLLRDVFLLDMEYPLDVSSVDSMPGLAGDGYFVALRANHPNNQGLYLFDAGSGQVTVFQHEGHTLFFSEDGRCLRLSKWEDEPSYRDVYELVWLDRPTVEQLLVVEGHVPRNHPQMFPRCLPRTSRLVFNSSQGVSLVSLPEGRTVGFWELAGEAAWIDVFPSPSEETLVIAADGDGLYYIALPAE